MPSNRGTRFHIGGSAYPVTLHNAMGKLGIRTRHNTAAFKAEMEAMEGCRKSSGGYTVANSFRNHFAIKVLVDAKQAYSVWDCEPKLPNDFDWGGGRNRHGTFAVDPYDHQHGMAAHVWTRRRSILVGEVGTAKTLPVLRVMQRVRKAHPVAEMFYVAPKSGVMSTKREMHKWNFPRIRVSLMTYEGLTRELRNWNPDRAPPVYLVLDESSRVKSEKAQRSTAALYLSKQMLVYYKGEEYVTLMTGTPSPKDPCDWWMQAEIARPGFLRESDGKKLRRRMAIYESAEGEHGFYPKLVQWRDGSECLTCDEWRNELLFPGMLDDKTKATYERLVRKCRPCGGTGLLTDEVTLLGKRLLGLVATWDKSVLNLPDQVFETLWAKPSRAARNAASVIAKTAGSTIEALNKLRQLSDGFLYDDDTKEPIMATTPKDDLLRGLLEQYEEIGRGVVYGAYHASVDRIVRVCKEAGWRVWKMDGRGVETWDGRSGDSAYEHFQDGPGGLDDRLVFVAHPKSGGMALTLTRSPWLAFYSNDFDGESRQQGEGRIHRPGMDKNLGATVYDLFHLETDELVFNRLKGKRTLQSIPLREIMACLESK